MRSLGRPEGVRWKCGRKKLVGREGKGHCIQKKIKRETHRREDYQIARREFSCFLEIEGERKRTMQHPA